MSSDYVLHQQRRLSKTQWPSAIHLFPVKGDYKINDQKILFEIDSNNGRKSFSFNETLHQIINNHRNWTISTSSSMTILILPMILLLRMIISTKSSLNLFLPSPHHHLFSCSSRTISTSTHRCNFISFGWMETDETFFTCQSICSLPL